MKTISLKRHTYFYTVNGEPFPQSMAAVNQAIRGMTKAPEVIKCESWANGATVYSKIEVKGKPGNYTIS